MRKKMVKQTVGITLVLLLVFCSIGFAENIDPDDAGNKYAYGENVGWLNADPANSGGSGMEVTASKLTGYIWSANIGWISLSCDNSDVCATSDYGVTNDGSGNLSGYAWSESAGWISFSCDNSSTCGTVNYGVTIDSETGEFSGYAWGANVGWIKFDHSQTDYRIKTSLTSPADSDNDGIPDEDDAFPADPNESSDNDLDGTGDNADLDDDNDGISDTLENAGPNGGDGNNDTIADSLQTNVTSLLAYDSIDEYVTMESPAGTTLSNCQSTDNPDPDNAPSNVDFTYGFFDFTINGIDPGDSTWLKLYFPADAVIETYYKYGQTPDNQVDHWYEFLYDGETGAEIDDVNKTVTLHFVDAERGDDVLTEDSMVIDLGGPGVTSVGIPAASGDGGGGSGCFISTLDN